MCIYVGIVVFNGHFEEIQTFGDEQSAMAFVNERRHVYGMRESTGSLIWDTTLQLPVRVAGT